MTPSPDPGLPEQIANQLRDRITGGLLTPGQRLSEAQLAADLGISRNTLREVFRLLTREGLLTHMPNRGVFVARPSMPAIVDIYRLRRLIEVPMLAQGWPQHPAVARMQEAVDHARLFQAAGDWRGWAVRTWPFTPPLSRWGQPAPHGLSRAAGSGVAAGLRVAGCTRTAAWPLHRPERANPATAGHGGCGRGGSPAWPLSGSVGTGRDAGLCPACLGYSGRPSTSTTCAVQAPARCARAA
ncbi:GntR family transcriptional regulator [Gemmobacter lanyuensis]